MVESILAGQCRAPSGHLPLSREVSMFGVLRCCPWNRQFSRMFSAYHPPPCPLGGSCPIAPNRLCCGAFLGTSYAGKVADGMLGELANGDGMGDTSLAANLGFLIELPG
jgi:hypothetical protein